VNNIAACCCTLAWALKYVAGQIGKAKLVIRRELPSHFQLDRPGSRRRWPP
jgi:hypothetical protein